MPGTPVCSRCLSANVSLEVFNFGKSFVCRDCKSIGGLEPPPKKGEPRLIYISGQMTGLPDEARPEFAAAAERLKAAGYSVRNPHDHPVRKTWCEYMRQDLEFIASPQCVGIALLPTAGKSPGAMVEIIAGLACGLIVRSVDGWINSSPVERDARSMLALAFAEGVPKLATRLADATPKTAASRPADFLPQDRPLPAIKLARLLTDAARESRVNGWSTDTLLETLAARIAHPLRLGEHG